MRTNFPEVSPLATDHFLNRLSSLELGFIANQLTNPLIEIHGAINRYKMYLCLLYLYPDIRLIPTQEVDLIWHQHLLHELRYRQHCLFLFGYIVNHYQYSCVILENEAYQQILDTSFSITCLLYRRHFGLNLQNLSSLTIPGYLQQPSGCGDLPIWN